jgi:hypothetical protein
MSWRAGSSTGLGHRAPTPREHCNNPPNLEHLRRVVELVRLIAVGESTKSCRVGPGCLDKRRVVTPLEWEGLSQIVPASERSAGAPEQN